MKQQIYNSWWVNFKQCLFIEVKFSGDDFEKCWYSAIVKTMRYISKNIHFSHGEFKNELKNDLSAVRDYYLSNI